MSFKDVLVNISAYLLRKYPPKCVSSLENAIERMVENIGYEKPNKINSDLTGTIQLSGEIAT
ncbi:MAG: hypothetical protein WAV32_03710 [Halobacteriota archaeon]